MLTEVKAHKKFPVRPFRRLVQLAVLAAIILVPLTTQNPADWFPSRIVQGQLPPPSLSPFSGDTWSFSFKGYYLANPLALFDSWISAKVIFIPLLLAALVPLVLTVVFGRFFCSWLCPVGFVMELNMKVNRAMSKIGFQHNFHLKNYAFTVLAVLLVLSFFLAAPMLAIFDPPHILGREMIYIFTHREFTIGLGLLLFFLLFEMFANSRALCGNFCPSGGGFCLLGAKRLWRIDMTPEKCISCEKCNRACPYDLEPMSLQDPDSEKAGDFNWIKCDNCGRCRDSCPTGAIGYRFGLGKR